MNTGYFGEQLNRAKYWIEGIQRESYSTRNGIARDRCLLIFSRIFSGLCKASSLIFGLCLEILYTMNVYKLIFLSWIGPLYNNRSCKLYNCRRPKSKLIQEAKYHWLSMRAAIWKLFAIIDSSINGRQQKRDKLNVLLGTPPRIPSVIKVLVKIFAHSIKFLFKISAHA